MSKGQWIRPSHRWLSIVLTPTVLANFAWRGMSPQAPPAWLSYSPLPPLFAQLFSGL